MTDTPRLTLPEIATGQSDKAATHNDALQVLDIIVQASVIDKDLSTPPVSPSNGDLYIVAATGTGAWAGHDEELAYYRSGWVFYAPFEGLQAWVADEDVRYVYDGSAWVNAAAAGLILEDLLDVVFTGLAPGDILRRDNSSPSRWVNEKPPVWIGTDQTSGAPEADEVMLSRIIPAAIVLPASMTGSSCKAGVAATAQTDFDVQKNGSSIATIRFAAAGTTASFINAGADTFAAGDILKVVAPSSPDATLADIVMTLAFTRS